MVVSIGIRGISRHNALPKIWLLATIDPMDEQKLTTLVFGNVVVESQMLGTQVRVYGEDMRSYYLRPSPYIDIAVPLDTLRKKVNPNQAKEIAEKIFDSVESELDRTYPGGVEQAQHELTTWLTNKEH